MRAESSPSSSRSSPDRGGPSASSGDRSPSGTDRSPSGGDGDVSAANDTGRTESSRRSSAASEAPEAVETTPVDDRPKSRPTRETAEVAKARLDADRSVAARQAEVQRAFDNAQLERVAGAEPVAGAEGVEAEAEPTPVERAAEVNALAETDPAAAAEALGRALETVEEVEARAELVASAAPALETLGRASMETPGVAEAVTGTLTDAARTLHEEGAVEVAEALAASFARGVDAADAEQVEETGLSHRPALNRALSAHVAAGRGADFAADVTVALAENARAHPSDRTRGLATSTANALGSGVRQLTSGFDEVAAEVAERHARLDRSIETFGPHLDAGSVQRAAEAITADTRPLLEDLDARAGRLHEAMEASARALDAMRALPTRTLDANAGGLAMAAEALAERMPTIASTVSGQAAMASTLERAIAGRRTFLDTVEESPYWSDAAREGAYSGLASGAALSAAARAETGQSLGPVYGELVDRAGGLLGAERQAAVGAALDALRTARDPAQLETALEGLERQIGPSAAGFVGAAGTFSSALSSIAEARNYPRLSRASGLAGVAGAMTQAGLGLASGEVDASVVIDSLRAGISLAGQLPRAPAGALGVLDRSLGVAGSAIGLVDALRRGDAVGVASSSASMYGLATGNPYVVAGAALFDLGRGLYQVGQDRRAQTAADRGFLEAAGFPTAAARDLAGLGGYTEGVFRAADAIRAQYPQLTQGEAVQHFFDTDGDYILAEELMRMNVPYTVR